MTLYKTQTRIRAELFERRVEWLMLWPLVIYSIVLYIEPMLFETQPHYAYIRQTFTALQWEIILLLVAFLRFMSLIARMMWGWPYYALFALPASLLGFGIWLQFTLSFFVGWVLFDTIPGPIAAHSTLMIAELMNVMTSSRDSGTLLRGWTHATRD